MKATSVRMTIRWTVSLGQSRIITDALHRIMIDARQQQGCLGCSLAAEAARGVGICFVEDWSSEDALARELRSDRFASLASLIESSNEPPSVEFRLPDGVQGIEYAERVRALPSPPGAECAAQ